MELNFSVHNYFFPPFNSHDSFSNEKVICGHTLSFRLSKLFGEYFKTRKKILISKLTNYKLWEEIDDKLSVSVSWHRLGESVAGVGKLPNHPNCLVSWVLVLCICLGCWLPSWISRCEYQILTIFILIMAHFLNLRDPKHIIHRWIEPL